MDAILITSKIFENFVYKSRCGIARGLYRQGGIGFIPRKPTLEEKFIHNLDLKNKIIFDIGGFYGLFTIYFANASLPNGKVYVFEPNPVNHKHIINNIKCNKLNNAQLIKTALGDENTATEMLYNPNSTGTGSIDTNINKNFTNKINVQLSTVDTQIQNGLPVPDFMKIDTEGYEYKILLGAKGLLESARPSLFLENHGATIPDKNENIEHIVSLLLKYDYVITHVESNTKIIYDNCHLAKEGHIYCNFEK